jgi:hypothetical protein
MAARFERITDKVNLVLCELDAALVHAEEAHDSAALILLRVAGAILRPLPKMLKTYGEDGGAAGDAP